MAVKKSGAMVQRNAETSHNETNMPKRNKNFRAEVLGRLTKICKDTRREREPAIKY